MAKVCEYPDDWRDYWEDRWDELVDEWDILNWSDDWDEVNDFLQDLWDAMNDAELDNEFDYLNSSNFTDISSMMSIWLRSQFETAENLGVLTENYPTYSPPPFDKTKLLTEAAKYSTYNALKQDLDNFDSTDYYPNTQICSPPFTITIQNGLGSARTSYIDYRLNPSTNKIGSFYEKEILIDGETSLEKGLLSLAFEMRNATLSEEFNRLKVSAINGTISKDDYVRYFMYYEAESMIAKMYMASDMGILQTTFSQGYIDGFQRLKNGSLTDKEFRTAIARADYNSTNILSNGKTRKEIYEDQYDGFRQMGIQAGY